MTHAVIEAERTALGAACVAPAAAVVVFGELTEADYFAEAHADAHRVIYKLFADRKPIGIADLLAGGLDPELAGSLLMDYSGAASAAEHYVAVVKGESRKRKLVALCGELIERSKRGDALELVGEMVSRAEAIVRDVSGKSRRFVECLKDAEKLIRDSRERAKRYGISGVSFGIPALDLATGGIFGPRLVIVAARPGCGKTALLNQVGLINTTRDMPGYVCSLEMSADELIVRSMAHQSGVNISGIMRGKVSPEEDDAATKSVTRLGDIPLWFDTDTYNLNGICGQIALAKARHNIAWFAVDHIGLIQTERFNNRNDQLGHITRTLKQLCKRLDIPCLAMCQLSRASETDKRKPGLHDLRDSGNIEQDADMVIMLHTEQTDRSQQKKPIQVGVLKNRTGPTAWIQERVEFDGQTQRIYERAT